MQMYLNPQENNKINNCIYTNRLLELVKFSMNFYNFEIKSFRDFCNRSKDNTEKWFELIYSILVSTQVKTCLAIKCYEKLIENVYDLLLPNFLLNFNDLGSIEQIIQKILHENGYRFYQTKSRIIINAIKFLREYNFNFNYLFENFNSFKKLRNELLKINGIGLKTASHWLRNMGFYIPVIDIHVKNLLYRFSVIDSKKISYEHYEILQNSICELISIDNISFDLALWFFGKDFCGNQRCRLCNFKDNCRKNLIENY